MSYILYIINNFVCGFIEKWPNKNLKNIMWKSAAGVNVEIPVENTDDDWETDPDFVNDVSEEEQRWGSRTVPGSGRVLDHVELVIFVICIGICIIFIY